MNLKYCLMLSFCIALASPLRLSAQAPTEASSGAGLTAATVIEKAIEQERLLEKRMTTLTPLIETYTQTMERHADLGAVPKNDKYFLGKLDLSHKNDQKSFLPNPGWISALGQQFNRLFSVTFIPEGFGSMIMLGPNFEKNRYSFTYVRKEFLGEVRCYVFDVQPTKATASQVGFIGRIWVEDQDFNVVRFNGSRTPTEAGNLYFHFDSWRENMGPGLWLPAYVYTEESDVKYLLGKRTLRFKGQTRLWGYNAGRTNQQDELTNLIVDSENVEDQADDSGTITPVEAFRLWQRQAEDNVLDRLETAGLLAREGSVNQVLETVINNLQITNDLDIEPPVRARILLTTPVESFAVGNTIVLSRGFIDVLPDEASLALALAHELAHIALGHGVDTKYAFNDRTLFRDEQTFSQLSLTRTAAEESAADKKAIEYLNNSPYKDKLGNAALFLRVLEERAAELPRLLRPHLGNQMVNNGKVKRMAELMPQAPTLEMERKDQIAALPLGGRIHVDLWNNTIELAKTKNLALQSPREKMPFEVTPIFIYLTRQQNSVQSTAAQTR